MIETATFNEVEVSAYCREKGLYPDQAKDDKKRIRQLEKELNRKEKALAETAALLVLRKKLSAFYEDESEEGYPLFVKGQHWLDICRKP